MPTPDAAHARNVALAQRILDVGEALLDALPTDTQDPLPVRAQAYEVVARALRRTILLVEHLAQPRALEAERRAAARAQIIRKVEDHIDLEAKSPSCAETLRHELLERLGDDHLEREIGTRPVEDIIADICRDLRLGAQSIAFRGKRRTPDDVRHLHALAAGRTDLARPPPAPDAEPPDAEATDDPVPLHPVPPGRPAIPWPAPSLLQSLDPAPESPPRWRPNQPRARPL